MTILNEIFAVINSDPTVPVANVRQLAREWECRCFTATEVAAWLQIGVWDAVTAVRFEKSGLTLEQIADAAEYFCQFCDSDEENSSADVMNNICNGELDVEVLIDHHAERRTNHAP